MAYDNWTIGGVTVPHVRTVANDQSSRTITLSCSALTENVESGEPRDEIALFEEMSCDVITNTQLMNGGSCLQVCNGDPVIVSDGVNAWVAALERVAINENKISEKRIDYDLVIHYETVPRGITYTTTGTYDPEESADEEDELDTQTISSKIYTRPYCGFDNIEYYRFTDESTNYPDCVKIGKMIITEERLVKQVVVTCYPISPNGNPTLEVNGTIQSLSLIDSVHNTLTYDLSPTTDTITLITQDNTVEDDPLTPTYIVQILGKSKTVELLSVKVVYE